MRVLASLAGIAIISGCGAQHTASQLQNNSIHDTCFQMDAKVIATEYYTISIGKIQNAESCIWGKEADLPSSADLAEMDVNSYSWTKILVSKVAGNVLPNQKYLQLSTSNASIILNVPFNDMTDVPNIDEKILLPLQIKQQFSDCFAKNEIPDFAIEFPETSVLGIRYNRGWESKRCGD